MSYGTPYIDEPKLYRKKAVGRAKTMPNKNQTNQADTSKPAKKYAKTRGEHLKDIVIAILIAGILAFVAGMHFANAQHEQVSKAVAAVQTAPAKK